MNLFNKEKELILKITNAILIIWIIAAACFTVNNIVELSFEDDLYAYEEYELLNCTDDNIEVNECKSMYLQEKVYNDNSRISYTKGLIISISIIVIVSGTIFILNKPSKNKKK